MRTKGARTSHPPWDVPPTHTETFHIEDHANTLLLALVSCPHVTLWKSKVDYFNILAVRVLDCLETGTLHRVLRMCQRLWTIDVFFISNIPNTARQSKLKILHGIWMAKIVFIFLVVKLRLHGGASNNSTICEKISPLLPNTASNNGLSARVLPLGGLKWRWVLRGVGEPLDKEEASRKSTIRILPVRCFGTNWARLSVQWYISVPRWVILSRSTQVAHSPERGVPSRS